jgi:Mce-associated membrane protein
VRAGGPGDPRRSRKALIALAVVVAMLALAVAGLWWLDHRYNRSESARDAALQAAREQVVPVLSYDFHSIDADLQRAGAALTGQFREEFLTVANQITAPAAREQQITTRATVIASSVVRADPEQVVVLLFVNQHTSSSQSEAVQLSAHRIQLTMSRVDDRWLISELERM